MPDTVLIAGASGRFGSKCASAFKDAGWTVRLFDRKNGDLRAAAQGVQLIVNALNPPNYENWETEIPRITEEVISAAKMSGATIMIPGNVYVFGNQVAPWRESTPHRANSKKGQIRIDMERTYREAGLPVIILRGGDFMDDGVTGTWADLIMLKKVMKGKFVYPGDPQIPHAWAYLPDLARAAVALAEKREQLEPFSDVCFPGYSQSGQAYMQAVEQATGQRLKMGKMEWWALKLASPFWRLGRELLEMRYLWDHPHALDGGKFNKILPEFEFTDFQTAVEKGLPSDIQPNQSVVRAERLSTTQSDA